METIFELISSWKEKNSKGVFDKIAKITSKRLDYLSSLCSEYKDLNVFDDIFWCGWWEFENISGITETHIEFYARHLYEGDYDEIIVPLRWFTITDVEFLNEIRTRKIKKIDNEVNKLQNKIDEYHKIKFEIENIKFYCDNKSQHCERCGTKLVTDNNVKRGFVYCPLCWEATSTSTPCDYLPKGYASN